MKTYILFNGLIQIIIIITSFLLYFDPLNIKLLYSLIIVSTIFIPTIFEITTKQVLKNEIHYLISLICLLLFTFLIVF